MGAVLRLLGWDHLSEKTEEAVEFLRLVSETDSENRADGMEDLRFRYGDQWPAQIQNSRKLENRPALTINETDSYCRQITNAMRQQRPRIKAHPVDSGADVKIAKVITGLTRHIEVNSDADNAYDLAGDYAVTMGWGYWRIRCDFIREDSFDQDIYIDQVENPFTVYFDPNSALPDGSDAERALVTDKMTKKAFRQQFPGADDGSGFTERSTGDVSAEWMTKDDIRIAEYFKVERTKARLVKLSNGDAFFEDELPPSDIIIASGLTVIGDRESYKRVVKWQKQTAFEVLEEKTWPGRWIPIVPTYGVTLMIDGKRKRIGAVRFARDPQIMVNFWTTTITESIAQAPKTKWLIMEGQDEGHENEWATVNTNAIPTLRFKPKSIDGTQFVPQRVQPEPPPQGAIVAAMQAHQNLQRVMGIFDPETNSTDPKSGKALNAERRQSEQSNYHFYDNLTRSIKHTGRQILDLQRKVYDTQRVMRIIGDDGRPELVTINEKKAIGEVLNDVTVGTYDVVMDTGPGYDTKRQEGFEGLMQLMATPLGEKVAMVGDDLIVRMMDVPGAEDLADRMAAANPLAQIDDKSEIPPKAQMMIAGLKQQVQQMGQALQAAGMEHKFGMDKEAMRQYGETKREMLRQTTKAHDIEVIGATKRHDTEARAVTAQNVAEINGLVQLLVKHIDTDQLERELAARNVEQQAKAAEQETLGQGA